MKTTVLGAAYAGGLATGFWKDFFELKVQWRKVARIVPGIRKMGQSLQEMEKGQFKNAACR